MRGPARKQAKPPKVSENPAKTGKFRAPLPELQVIFKNRLQISPLAGHNQRMSEMLAMDTHRFVKNLTKSGFTEAQAEALAEEQVCLFTGQLVTRDYFDSEMARFRAELTAYVDKKLGEQKAYIDKKLGEQKAHSDKEMANLRAYINTELAGLKHEMLKWLIGLMVAQAGLILAITQLG